MARTVTSTKKKSAESRHPKQPRTLTWHAQEIQSRKRWWWHLAVVALCGWLALFAIGFEQWTLLAVIIAAAAVLVVSNRGKVRDASMRIDAKKIVIDEREYLIENFRAFTLDEVNDYILLIPKKRFAPATSLIPSDQVAVNDKIIAQLEKHLTYIETRPGPADALERWLKLR